MEISLVKPTLATAALKTEKMTTYDLYDTEGSILLKYVAQAVIKPMLVVRQAAITINPNNTAPAGPKKWFEA
jgi:hypothetical protein